MVEITQIRHEHQSKDEVSRNTHMTYVVFFHTYGQFPVPQNKLERHKMCIYRYF